MGQTTMCADVCGCDVSYVFHGVLFFVLALCFQGDNESHQFAHVGEQVVVMIS